MLFKEELNQPCGYSTNVINPHKTDGVTVPLCSASPLLKINAAMDHVKPNIIA